MASADLSNTVWNIWLDKLMERIIIEFLKRHCIILELMFFIHSVLKAEYKYKEISFYFNI